MFKFARKVELRVMAPGRKSSVRVKVDPQSAAKSAAVIRHKVLAYLEKHRDPLLQGLLDAGFRLYFQRVDAVIDESLPLSVYAFKNDDIIFLQKLDSSNHSTAANETASLPALPSADGPSFAPPSHFQSTPSVPSHSLLSPPAIPFPSSSSPRLSNPPLPSPYSSFSSSFPSFLSPSISSSPSPNLYASTSLVVVSIPSPSPSSAAALSSSASAFPSLPSLPTLDVSRDRAILASITAARQKEDARASELQHHLLRLQQHKPIPPTPVQQQRSSPSLQSAGLSSIQVADSRLQDPQSQLVFSTVFSEGDFTAAEVMAAVSCRGADMARVREHCFLLRQARQVGLPESLGESLVRSHSRDQVLEFLQHFPRFCNPPLSVPPADLLMAFEFGCPAPGDTGEFLRVFSQLKSMGFQTDRVIPTLLSSGTNYDLCLQQLLR